jgi:hypothetical protein
MSDDGDGTPEGRSSIVISECAKSAIRGSQMSRISVRSDPRNQTQVHFAFSERPARTARSLKKAIVIASIHMPVYSPSQQELRKNQKPRVTSPRVSDELSKINRYCFNSHGPGSPP